jgi:chromate transport protein ChrA
MINAGQVRKAITQFGWCKAIFLAVLVLFIDFNQLLILVLLGIAVEVLSRQGTDWTAVSSMNATRRTIARRK